MIPDPLSVGGGAGMSDYFTYVTALYKYSGCWVSWYDALYQFLRTLPNSLMHSYYLSVFKPLTPMQGVYGTLLGTTECKAHLQVLGAPCESLSSGAWTNVALCNPVPACVLVKAQTSFNVIPCATLHHLTLPDLTRVWYLPLEQDSNFYLNKGVCYTYVFYYSLR